MIRNILSPYLNNKVWITNALFIITTTVGIVLVVGGLSAIILASTMTASTSDAELMHQSVMSVLGPLPGVPINIQDLGDASLSSTGLVSWIIGLNLLVVGLGLWQRSKFAKWVAIIIFGLAAFFNFAQFMFFGVLGAPAAIVGLFINVLILYLLIKADFNIKPTFPLVQIESEIPTMVPETSKITAVYAESSIQNDKEDGDLVAVAMKEPVMASQKEIDFPPAPVTEKTYEVSPGTSEVRIIVREIPVIVNKDVKASKGVYNQSKTRVIIQRSSSGVPIVIVETKVERNSETPLDKNRKQAKQKPNNA